MLNRCRMNGIGGNFMLTQYLFPFFVLKNKKVGERIFSAEKGLDLLRGEMPWS